MAGVKRLFFGDFLLARQKKVTALSGASPDADEQAWKEKAETSPFIHSP
jgi:hypothetical protein